MRKPLGEKFKDKKDLESFYNRSNPYQDAVITDEEDSGYENDSLGYGGSDEEENTNTVSNCHTAGGSQGHVRNRHPDGRQNDSKVSRSSDKHRYSPRPLSGERSVFHSSGVRTMSGERDVFHSNGVRMVDLGSLLAASYLRSPDYARNRDVFESPSGSPTKATQSTPVDYDDYEDFVEEYGVEEPSNATAGPSRPIRDGQYVQDE